jgi:hypothetical protein
MQREPSYLQHGLPHSDLLAPSPAEAVPAYTITARVLHWTTAFLILIMIPLGVVMANDWGGSQKDLLYDLHRSLGAVLIPILALRLIYRLANPPLPLPDVIPAMQRRAADMTHWSLYALLIAQPLRRLGRDVGLSRGNYGIRLVRAAADLAREPRFLGMALFSSPMDCSHHCMSCCRPYRGSPPPSFRAQGPRAYAHDHRLMG